MLMAYNNDLYDEIAIFDIISSGFMRRLKNWLNLYLIDNNCSQMRICKGCQNKYTV